MNRCTTHLERSFLVAVFAAALAVVAGSAAGAPPVPSAEAAKDTMIVVEVKYALIPTKVYREWDRLANGPIIVSEAEVKEAVAEAQQDPITKIWAGPRLAFASEQTALFAGDLCDGREFACQFRAEVAANRKTITLQVTPELAERSEAERTTGTEPLGKCVMERRVGIRAELKDNESVVFGGWKLGRRVLLVAAKPQLTTKAAAEAAMPLGVLGGESPKPGVIPTVSFLVR